MSDLSFSPAARSPELQALLDELAAEASREKTLRNLPAGDVPAEQPEPEPEPSDSHHLSPAALRAADIRHDQLLIDDLLARRDRPAEPGKHREARRTIPDVIDSAELNASADTDPPQESAVSPGSPVSPQGTGTSHGSTAAPVTLRRRPPLAMALTGGIVAALVAILVIALGNRAHAVPQGTSPAAPASTAATATR